MSPLHKPAPMRPDLAERKIRQVCAWIVLCLLLEAELGLAWDRRWHDYVGRDQFWIPPHIMMYVGIAGTGLISLFVVLLDTVRYRQRKAGVLSIITGMNCMASMSHYGLPSISWEFLGELWQGWELFISSLRRQCMNGKWSIHRAAFSASMDLNGASFY